jgi:hypothetical protein
MNLVPMVVEQTRRGERELGVGLETILSPRTYW